VATTRPASWGAVLRSALLFSPFLALALTGLTFLVLEAMDEGFGAGQVVAITILGFVSLLFGYQVVQSVRDLFSGVVETTGVVERRWSHNDFLLFRNSYIFVARNVFRLEPEQYIEVALGDTVRVVHFPHTSMVEALELVERGGAGRPGDA
jgi:xanthosine utilization system XapX-like protein